MRERISRLRVHVLALLAAACAPVLAAEQAATAEAADALRPWVAAYERAARSGAEADAYREMIGTVIRRVRRDYPLAFDDAPLVEAAVNTLQALEPGSGEPVAIFKRSMNAALAALDPHSSYLDARDYERQRSSISGSFGGLGMEVDMSEGLVRIVAPMEGTPAARAGLKAGDLIVRFDGQQVLGLTLADALSRLRGEPGTPVTLLIRRPDREDEFEVTLVREIIRSPVLRASMEEDILVLRLARFAGSLKSQLDKAIAEASAARPPRAVIVDLRGNPGGLLSQAIAFADEFLVKGDIVSIQGRGPGSNRRWQANPAEILAGLPMVVLIDGGSASAAELVAAALQDQGRATVMGQRSFGKGSVQTIVSMGRERGALQLTTALYYSPSGRTVQLTGVGPDIELVPPAGAPAPRGGRREGSYARALPGAAEPAAPRARVEEGRCPKASKAEDRMLGCAVAFLKRGAVEAFVAALEPEAPVR